MSLIPFQVYIVGGTVANVALDTIEVIDFAKGTVEELTGTGVFMRFKNFTKNKNYSSLT